MKVILVKILVLKHMRIKTIIFQIHIIYLIKKQILNIKKINLFLKFTKKLEPTYKNLMD